MQAPTMPLKLEPMEDPALNLTPMVDVVLNLVMFFLVTTHFSKAEQEQQYPIELPKVTAAQPLTGLPDEIVVNVARDGSIYLGKQQRTPDALELELKAAVARYKDQEVMIRGDADGAFQHVMTVMNICHRAGITNLRLANRLLGGESP
jgi:biopolymer transport protein ExbD